MEPPRSYLRISVATCLYLLLAGLAASVVRATEADPELSELLGKMEEKDRLGGVLSLKDVLDRMDEADEALPTQDPDADRGPVGRMRGRMRMLHSPLVVPGDGAEPDADGSAPGIVVDGRLDDALWKQAAVSGEFWCSFEDAAPAGRTEVLAARDSRYLYFGFRLHDSQPDTIQAATTVRDVGLAYDDAIHVQLDTFFNRRDISEFSLNPIGTQSDDFSGGRSGKVEWKGDWLGSATRTDYGWSAEFALPFSILNYNREGSTFGINFRRYQSRTKQHSYWADITPRGLPEEMGELRGLELPETGKRDVWTFMPFALAGANLPDKKGEIQDTLITAGIDIRYQPRPDLTGMLSLNPDFTQIEEAITDISFSYSEKALDENRPFFVEGEDYFRSTSDGNEYFYSNRAADFDVGGKGFGRAGKTQFGLLATSAPEDRFDGAGRILHELDETHSAIGTVTATSQEEFDNVLAAGQFEGRTDDFEYALDAAVSGTQADDPDAPVDGGGSHFIGALGWQGDHAYLRGEADSYDTEYFPALGLLASDLPGTHAGEAITGYYREQTDSFWRIFDGYAGFSYRGTDENQLQNRKFLAGATVEFENQVRTSLYAEEGPYRPVTAERGVFEDFTYDDHYYSAAVDFNTRSSVYSVGARYDGGELGGGDYEYGTVYGWWKPVNPLYLRMSAERTKSFGTADQVVATGSWNLTQEQVLGGRYIYTDDVEFYRLAYSYKPREGWDIFAVYDDSSDPGKDPEYSVKVVKTF
jgi:hypothetical protein